MGLSLGGGVETVAHSLSWNSELIIKFPLNFWWCPFLCLPVLGWQACATMFLSSLKTKKLIPGTGIMFETRAWVFCYFTIYNSVFIGLCTYFFIFANFYFYVYVSAPVCKCPSRPEEGVHPLDYRNSWAMQCGCWEPLSPLGEPGLLTAQHHAYCGFIFVVVCV